MNCWHCGTELIWGGDHDIEEEGFDYFMVTNLSCPECNSYVEVYAPKKQNGVNLSLDNHQELTLMSRKKRAASARKQCESPDFHGIKQKGMVACTFAGFAYRLNRNFTEQK